MKKLMYLVMSIAMSLFAADASAQSYLPTITSTACIVNGAGDIVTSGTLVIVGTDQNDNPIPYRVNSSNQATTAPISRTITNGQLATSLQLANPTLTSPVGVLYRIVIQDNVTKKLTVYKQVIIAANSGSNYDLCIANLTPSTAAVTTVTNPGTVNGNTVQNGDFTINGRDIDTKQTITFSATPTFDCSSVAGGSYFKLTLTGNVTSSTLSNCNDGQSITLELCQDATGSRTFVAPTNIQSFTTISSTASTCTSQFFKYDGGISKAIPDTVATPFSNSAGLAALLSDETGTGLAVFNNSPSLITPTIDSINQKAATAFTIKDNTGGTRFSIPSGGTTQSQTFNTSFTGPSTSNTVELLTSGCTPQGPTASINGTGAAADIFTCSLLANTVENAKILHVICSATHDTGTANVAVAINLNGVQVLAASTGTAASQSVALEAYILRTGTTTAQTWGLGMNTTGTTQPFSVAVTGLAFTSNQTLNCQFSVASGDHMTGRVWAPMSIQ